MPVALVDELAERTTKKFFATIDGVEEECFLVKYGGRFYAYVNRCCHVPMTLDWVENRFFTADGRYLQCATHGARYLPETGECVAGPPCGKFLRRLEVSTADGKVYVAVGARASLEGNR
jgi:nitrite reductase/ring-hydroxylating ferredoxin subunit